jgi:hypothetical protein
MRVPFSLGQTAITSETSLYTYRRTALGPDLHSGRDKTISIGGQKYGRPPMDRTSTGLWFGCQQTILHRHGQRRDHGRRYTD